MILTSPLITWIVILVVIFALALFKVTLTNEEAKAVAGP